MLSSGKLVAAICAAPAKVLVPLGVLSGKRATCFPGDEHDFGSDVYFSEERVVQDGNLITSRGAGTAAEFSEELIRYLAGDKAAREIHLRTVQKN
jgi:4-methyl-5(b-hydroxyethyl)-thiazole monophosphate biosynthesis